LGTEGRKRPLAEKEAASIFDKLGVSNRLELVLFAIDKRLVLQASRT